MWFKRKKGQSAVEYVLLITAVAVALVAISMVVQRAIQDRAKESAKEVGNQFDPNQTADGRGFYRGWVEKGQAGQSTTTYEVSGNPLNPPGGVAPLGGKATVIDENPQVIEKGETEAWGNEMEGDE